MAPLLNFLEAESRNEEKCMRGYSSTSDWELFRNNSIFSWEEFTQSTEMSLEKIYDACCITKYDVKSDFP